MPGSDDGSRSNKGGRWDVSKVYCQLVVESTDVEMHLSIKLRRILRPIGRPSSKSKVGF